MVSENKKPTVDSGWSQAAVLAERFAARPGRADALLCQGLSGMVPVERRRCQRLFLGVVRWFGVLKTLMTKRLAKPPSPTTRGALWVAGFELIETFHAGDDRTAKIVHHAVNWAKVHVRRQPEQGLINAVLRRWAEDLPALLTGPARAECFGLPDWLWDRWVSHFGLEAAAALARWQLEPASVYLRWRGSEPPRESCLEASPWPGFWRVRESGWPEAEALLAQGLAYAQDPFTSRPIELLAPQPGEYLLDLCAAPGGKTLTIADALAQADGHIIAVDLPGNRIKRLDENFAHLSANGDAGPQVKVVAADVFDLDPTEFGLFQGVLLDAPCSNTGVIRRRPDVKWRLTPADIPRCADLQSRLLNHAARLVAPGGRLVYSTCSLEPEENDAVVEHFLREQTQFSKLAGDVSQPWKTNHDGGGAFLLRRAIPPSGEANPLCANLSHHS